MNGELTYVRDFQGFARKIYQTKEVFSKSNETSKLERFTKIVNSSKLLSIFAKLSIGIPGN